MNRNEFHRQAQILNGPVYDGNLIEKLVETVEARQRIDVVDTTSTAAGSALEGDNCEHCHAAYGHKSWCPTFSNTEADAILAHGLGVKWN